MLSYGDTIVIEVVSFVKRHTFMSRLISLSLHITLRALGSLVVKALTRHAENLGSILRTGTISETHF